MAREFKLKNDEKQECFVAVNSGDGKGFSIAAKHEKLKNIKTILDEIGKDAKRDGDLWDFKDCNEGRKIKLSEKEYRTLIESLKNCPWSTAFKALKVEELIDRLEEIPPIKDKKT